MIGCTAHNAVDAAALVAFLDSHTVYDVGGHPVRRRRTINGDAVTATDARVIRRWRNGGTVTAPATRRVLEQYRLTTAQFTEWCEARTITPLVRGTL